MVKLIKAYVLFLLVSGLICEAGCAVRERYSDPQLQELVRMRCTKCHLAYYYEEKRHTRLIWELVVLRMQILHGEELNRGERSTIATYMARVRPPSSGQAVFELFGLGSPILLIMALVLRYLKRDKARFTFDVKDRG